MIFTVYSLTTERPRCHDRVGIKDTRALDRGSRCPGMCLFLVYLTILIFFTVDLLKTTTTAAMTTPGIRETNAGARDASAT